MPKTNFFTQFFLPVILFEGTFTLFFKDKKVKKSHKIEGFKIFLIIFA
jgi:hypothetical protein